MGDAAPLSPRASSPPPQTLLRLCPLPGVPSFANSSSAANFLSLRIEMHAMFQGTFWALPTAFVCPRGLSRKSPLFGKLWAKATLPIGHQLKGPGQMHPLRPSGAPGSDCLDVGPPADDRRSR